MPGSAVSDLAGRVLAGRYLLHTAIGTGASGRVYVADDTRLRRRVAVKVLHAALADDAAFLRRFRAEAQLAASMHHPHIVTVHDWGEDDVPFMVLELLEGGSLRSIMDDGTRLSVAQAARVGRDVASALDYAHARGVLHRDIKPANLLFDEHGIVRVADFGLARALAEASWTEPAGALFGTARYASPEQARGVQLDGRSDMYSLALVLVESVSGSVPFSADTTLGTLSARTHQSLIAPEELGVLASVVERAGALEPEARYPNASTMRAALSDAAEALPPPAPIPLAGMHDRDDPNPTRAVTGSTKLFDQDTAEIVREPVAVAAPEPVEPEERRRAGERRFVPFVVAVVLLLTVGLAAAALAHVGGATPVAAPSLAGLRQQDAIALAQRNGFEATVGPQRPSSDPAGVVIGQSPGAGAFTTGRHITLVVSTGPPRVKVPEVVGKQWADVRPALDAAGFQLTKVDTYDETHAKGIVLSIDPAAGKDVAAESKVKVTVSNGHAPVAVPDVTGESFDDASAALTANHFKVARGDDEFSSSVKSGKVARTDPAEKATAPYGSTVTVFVSKGPELVNVPDLHNLTLSEATGRLHGAGLEVGDISGWNSDTDTVVGQSPKSDKRAVRGSKVDLSFSSPGIIDCILSAGQNCP